MNKRLIIKGSDFSAVSVDYESQHHDVKTYAYNVVGQETDFGNKVSATTTGYFTQEGRYKGKTIAGVRICSGRITGQVNLYKIKDTYDVSTMTLVATISVTDTSNEFKDYEFSTPVSLASDELLCIKEDAANTYGCLYDSTERIMKVLNVKTKTSSGSSFTAMTGAYVFIFNPYWYE